MLHQRGSINQVGEITKIGGTNMKLTKEIARSLNKDFSNGFLYYGKILGSDIYRIISTQGGKRGNPFFFAIDDNGEVERLRGLEIIGNIRRINPKPQLVSPELVYQDL